MVRMFHQTVLFSMEEVVIQIIEKLFSKENIDGGLIGGVSLNANSFVEIIKSF